MNDLTILHLSDLHIDGNGKKYSQLLKSLIQDLKDRMDEFLNAHYVLVITGDIINMGNINAFETAKEFFSDLKKNIGDRLSGIYIVPGNHDKRRTDVNKLLIPAYRTYIDNNTSYFKEKAGKEMIGFDDTFFEQLWKFQKETYKESGYLDLIDLIYEKMFPQFKEIGEVVKDTFGVHVLEIEGKNYCFILLNTAWSCIDDNDGRHVVIGDFQLSKIKKQYDELTFIKEPSLTLAMGHHPLNFLYGNEQDKVFNQLIFRDGVCSEAYLCGHTHDRDIINWSNTNHTMYTLMTGIGWPDKDPNNQQYHYYSIYNFNLDINSMEIFVRSTRDTVFRADLSIYGKNEDTTCLARAIRPDDSQIPITISTADVFGQKTIFPAFSFKMDSINFSQAISRVSSAAQVTMMEDYFDFSDNCIIPDNNEPDDNEHIKDLIYTRFRSIISDDDEDIDNDVKSVFENPSNKKRIYSNFEGFIQRLCQSICEELVGIQNNLIIRSHFRYLKDRSTYTYSELCNSFYGEIDIDQIQVHDMRYGDLLEAAFNKSITKSLVYSANKHICKNQLDSDEKWVNYITIIPSFPENIYHKKVSKLYYKDYPYITFGVTVDDHNNDNLLYLMDYYRMDTFFGDILKKYVRCFGIDMNEFCLQCKKG